MENYKKIKIGFVIFLVVLMVVSFAVLKTRQLSGPKIGVNNFGNQNQVATSIPAIKLTGVGEMKKFNNYDELKTFLENNLNQAPSGIRTFMGGMANGANIKTASGMTAAPVPTLAPAAINGQAGTGAAGQTVGQTSGQAASQTAGQSSADYSRTNVQVAGVDEADIIKTDGQYIYAVTQNDLFIIAAYPGASAQVLSKIEFKARPQDIYISGDRLAVFGANDQIYNTKIYQTFRRQSAYTFFKVFDIADKKNPKQIRDLDFEGSYFDSRMVGDYVYFVTNNYNYYITPDPIVPRILDNGAALTTSCGPNAKCYNPDIYYFNIPYNSYNFTSVNAINIKDPTASVSGNIYLTDAGQNMYVSPNNIYITYTKYINEYDLQMQVARDIIYPRLNTTDQNLITKIEAVDNDVLNQSERQAKVRAVLQRYLNGLTDADLASYNTELDAKMKQKYQDLSKELEKTMIYKIAIDKDKMEYKASGSVTGSVLNQFSMDENGDYFRIATTRSQTWSEFTDQNRDSYNNLYVLNNNLQVVGSLEDLAPGEKIYSARFLGNRAYLSTFKQTDPLFTIDLTNPTSPKVLGQLSVPGFSTYLHPYDADTLIGFGKDATDLGAGGVKTNGLKLALFDVKDINNPKVLDTYSMGDMGSDSLALYDHKAFLFSKDKNLLVLPVALRKSTAANAWGDLTFNGAMVFQINDNKFKLVGRIDHSSGGQMTPVDYWNGYGYYDNTVQRALYINDELYTFSNQYLKINNLSDLSEIKNLPLQKYSQSDFQVIN